MVHIARNEAEARLTEQLGQLLDNFSATVGQLCDNNWTTSELAAIAGSNFPGFASSDFLATSGNKHISDTTGFYRAAAIIKLAPEDG